jgi:hypothetical protein
VLHGLGTLLTPALLEDSPFCSANALNGHPRDFNRFEWLRVFRLRCRSEGGNVSIRTGGFSAPTGEIPQAHLPGGCETLKRSGFPEVTAFFWLAQLLPLWEASTTCFEQLSFRSC